MGFDYDQKNITPLKVQKKQLNMIYTALEFSKNLFPTWKSVASYYKENVQNLHVPEKFEFKKEDIIDDDDLFVVLINKKFPADIKKVQIELDEGVTCICFVYSWVKKDYKKP